METLTLQTKKLVNSEIVLPQYFTLKSYQYFKILSPISYLTVTNYETDTESMQNLEVYPSIKVDHVRYLEIFVRDKEVIEITEEEFNKQLKKSYTLISKL